jgi:type II secretory pathway predicted ATPase ExeA
MKIVRGNRERQRREILVMDSEVGSGRCDKRRRLRSMNNDKVWVNNGA